MPDLVYSQFRLISFDFYFLLMHFVNNNIYNPFIRLILQYLSGIVGQ